MISFIDFTFITYPINLRSDEMSNIELTKKTADELKELIGKGSVGDLIWVINCG